jgi:hypothetical protein
MPLHVAARPDGIVLSPSRATIERALAGADARRSILDDAAFAADAARVEEGHTLVAMANPGRCIAFAGAMMDPGELERMAPIAELLRDTVVTLGIEHTDTRLGLRARVSALPDVSGLVAQALGRRHAPAERPGVAAARPAPAATALSAATHWEPMEAGTSPPGGARALRTELERFAHEGDFAAAEAVGRELVGALHDDANALNDLAWTLSTEDPYAGRLVDLCASASERSNELTGYRSWYHLDTLALVKFQLGDVREAVRLERLAVELAAGDPRAGEARKALERYEAALAEVVLTDS